MIKHIPRGVAIQEDSSWEYTEAVGVRMTPDDPAAVLELSQDMTIGGYDEPVEQCIGLSHGQMITLRDVLTTEINKLS
jgi:hypothetical protein